MHFAPLFLVAGLTFTSAAPLSLLGCFGCVLPKNDVPKGKFATPGHSPRDPVPEHIDSSALYPKPTTIREALKVPHPDEVQLARAQASSSSGPRHQRSPPSYDWDESPNHHGLLSHSPSPDNGGDIHATLNRIENLGALTRSPSRGFGSEYDSQKLFSIPLSTGRVPHSNEIETSGELWSLPLAGNGKRLSSARPTSRPGSSSDSRFPANKHQLVRLSSRNPPRTSAAKEADAPPLTPDKGISPDKAPGPKKVKLYQYMRTRFLNSVSWERRPSNFHGHDTEFTSSP